MDGVPVLVAHADFGDPNCCGIIRLVVRADQADLKCNECGAVIRTVPAAEAEQTLLQMARSQSVWSEICPACRGVSTFPGITGIEAYRCRHCGARVVVQGSVE